MKNDTKEIKEKYLKSSNTLVEVLLALFVIVSLCLSLTLYFYFKVNSSNANELGLVRDVHFLRAQLSLFNNRNKNIGFLEVKEIFEGFHVMGKIEGLTPGSYHGIHILEYSDLITMKNIKENKSMLTHFNPSHLPHSCPDMNNFNDKYHVGDLGNVIANKEGEAFFSITKKNSISGLSGRMIVITKTKDKCESQKDYDEISDIYGVGLLAVFKTQEILNNANGKEDYLIREINSINKENLDRSLNKPSSSTGATSVLVPKVVNSKRIMKKEETNKEVVKHTEQLPKNIVDLKDIFSLDRKPPAPSMYNHKRIEFNNDVNFPLYHQSHVKPVHKINNYNNDYFNVLPKKHSIVHTTTLLNDDDVYPNLKRQPLRPRFEKTRNSYSPVYHSKYTMNDDSDKEKAFRLMTDNLVKKEKDLEDKEKNDINGIDNYNKPRLTKRSPYADSFIQKSGPENNVITTPKMLRIMKNTPPILTQIIEIPSVNNNVLKKKFEDQFPEKSYNTIDSSITLEKEREIIDKKLKESISNLSKMDGYDFITNPKKFKNNPQNDRNEKNTVKLKELNSFLRDENIKKSNNYKNLESDHPKNINEDVKIVLLNNTKTFIKTIDQELINPYTGIIRKKNINEKRLFENLHGYEDKIQGIALKIKNESSLNHTSNITVNKIDEEGINIFNKFDDINNIIKNKTITTLNEIHHYNDNNNNNVERKNTSNTYNYNYTNNLTTTNKVYDDFNPFDLLKFKENDYANALETLKSNKTRINIPKPLSNKLNLTKKKKLYETTKKMFENIDHQHKYELKLNNNAKLFLNHFKKNIDKIDEMVHKDDK